MLMLGLPPQSQTCKLLQRNLRCYAQPLRCSRTISGFPIHSICRCLDLFSPHFGFFWVSKDVCWDTTGSIGFTPESLQARQKHPNFAGSFDFRRLPRTSNASRGDDTRWYRGPSHNRHSHDGGTPWYHDPILRASRWDCGAHRWCHDPIHPSILEGCDGHSHGPDLRASPVGCSEPSPDGYDGYDHRESYLRVFQKGPEIVHFEWDFPL